MSCGVGRRFSWDLKLLWLWRRLVATAPIWPLAWELPHALGGALKRKKKKKKKSQANLEDIFAIPMSGKKLMSSI